MQRNIPIRSKSTKKTAKSKQVTQNVVPLPVDPDQLKDYLTKRIANGSNINIRYQSQRQNSAKKWRSLYPISFDQTYIFVDGYDGYPHRYRLDRVVEIK